MGNELVFRAIVLILIVAFVAHRGYYTRRQAAPAEDTLKKRERAQASYLAGILAMAAFAATILYAVHPAWLSWAAAAFPLWVRWFGAGIALAGFALLQWAQITLGRSWSDAPRMLKQQRLVKSGPYRWIRHPIYTAFVMILGALLFVSANWLVGLCWLGMTMLESLSRIRFEEALMCEYFGREYLDYMETTGAFVPKLRL